MTPRYIVLRTDVAEDMDPAVPVVGYVSVEGGALVFRNGAFAPPHLIIASGSWSDVWLDTKEAP